VLTNDKTQYTSKQIAVSAYGSLAISLKKHLLPFLPSIIAVLHPILFLPITPQNSQVVGESFQSLGKISSNVCAEDRLLFEKYVAGCVEYVYKVMVDSEDP
jgi:hypothetical protein